MYGSRSVLCGIFGYRYTTLLLLLTEMERMTHGRHVISSSIQISSLRSMTVMVACSRNSLEERHGVVLIMVSLTNGRLLVYHHLGVKKTTHESSKDTLHYLDSSMVNC